ncbi:protein ECERIFERUM 26-like [Tripterygium wilfordii]|uniref:Protein ECERIFERUM 26-like n=1 Tax=Tripterygium wilfordii TaxID=458696 RepID=A0A7J7E236_TRIWF|nr:protein ECERIFERUM 26-like [Tripterygium wilfordii]KAF5752524.1 protein ECERIFERUM 26-like [Tripterygium wilfordii]
MTTPPTRKDGDDFLVYNLKLSSVGPSRVTGSDVTHEPNGLDIAMKLHYVMGVYFFGGEAALGVTVTQMKDSMFTWCNDYYVNSGRFWRSGSGRPYMKCNDCGVRFIEAKCDKTVEEWLQMVKDCKFGLNKLLVYHLPIGPDLSFSPSLFIQLTRFKCGGISMGLSWAHVLGDVLSVSDSFNAWAQVLSGIKSNGLFHIPKQPIKPKNSDDPVEPLNLPGSVKRVGPVGDCWVTANNGEMETFSFHISSTHLTHLQSKIWGEPHNINQIPSFESICAIIWHCIANVSEGGVEPNIVTVCKKDPIHTKTGILSNTQIISTIKADFSVAEADLQELATLLVDKIKDEKSQIEEAVERENDGACDYIVYGANLTFLDLEEADLYGIEVNGFKPELVYYTIQGVGDAGMVIVHAGPGDYDGGGGRIATLILLEKQLAKVKYELKKNGVLLETEIE